MLAKALSLSAALALLIVGSSLASPPHSASWKASGMPDRERGAIVTRYYEPAGYAAAPQAERRTFSYEPRAAQPRVTAARQVVTSPQADQGRRTFSYEPAAAVMAAPRYAAPFRAAPQHSWENATAKGLGQIP